MKNFDLKKNVFNKTAHLLILFGVIFTLNGFAASKTKNQSVENVTAFVGVNIIPMDRERVIENQTVIVENGRIKQIGDAKKIKIPAGAVRIDGKGKFLMPGLIDMHGHLSPTEGNANDLASQQMMLFLANGVTTLRNMIGAPAHLVLREKVAKGEVLGPTLFTAGPPISAQNATSPESAAQIVTSQKQAGYDLLKVLGGFTPETYDSIVKTARGLGIPFAGHVGATVGLNRALNAKQTSIEHLDGYLQALAAQNSPVTPPPSQVVVGPILKYLEESKIPVLAQNTKTAGVYNTPTLALFKIIVSDDKAENYLKWKEMQYVPVKMRETFAKNKDTVFQVQAPAEEKAKYVTLRNKMVKALYESGAKLLIGPDSPQLFMVPGFATHREMQSFVEAGLKPYAALEAATRNGAEYLGKSKDIGTIEVGKQGDLVLLEANPLQSIDNASRIAGVMVKGRWLPRNVLDQKLEEIASINKQ